MRGPPTYRDRVTTTQDAPLSIDPPALSTPVMPTVMPTVTPTAPPWRLLASARAQDVTGPAAVAAASLITAVGVGFDVPGDPSLGTGTGVAVVIAAIVATGAVRLRALATAAVLPPLLVAAAALALAVLGGRNEGSRELVLDVGTTLALSAPLVFAATAAGLGVVLVRVVQHLSQRRR